LKLNGLQPHGRARRFPAVQRRDQRIKLRLAVAQGPPKLRLVQRKRHADPVLPLGKKSPDPPAELPKLGLQHASAARHALHLSLNKSRSLRPAQLPQIKPKVADTPLRRRLKPYVLKDAGSRQPRPPIPPKRILRLAR